MMNKCEICGEGIITEKHQYDEIQVNGFAHQVKYVYQECNECGSEYVGSLECKKNQAELEKIKKSFQNKTEDHLSFGV